MTGNPASHIFPVIVLEIGDVRTDGRCKNICSTILKWGAKVFFIQPADEDSESEFENIRIIKRKIISEFGSKIFYLHYNLRAFITAMYIRPRLVVAEDLFSLPAAAFIKLFSGAKVLYDAKEFYFALAALKDRPVTQKFWQFVERVFIRYADVVITAGERDNDVIKDRYGVPRPVAIHNHPPRRENPVDKNFLRKKYSIPDEYKIFLYQGWLLRGRGLFHLLEIVQRFQNIFLIIIGDGPLRQDLEESSLKMNISDRVLFTGAIDYTELLEYTAGADVGCALIEDYGMSYRYARPNKMFEYIQVGVPVLVSKFEAMEEVVNSHRVGLAVNPDNRDELFEGVKKFIEDEMFHQMCAKNSLEAAQVFNWENEEEKLMQILNEFD